MEEGLTNHVLLMKSEGTNENTKGREKKVTDFMPKQWKIKISRKA